jgi:hypothetical protein
MHPFRFRDCCHRNRRANENNMTRDMEYQK